MRVILVRHASTASTLARRYAGGTSDESLCDQGRRELACIPSEKPVNRVYVSTSKRTQETARILFPCAKQIEVEDLREMEFGVFEGKTSPELEDDQSYRYWVQTGCESTCPKGEKKEDFTRRCSNAFREILERESKEGHTTVYFVVHAGTIMAILSTFLATPRAYFSLVTKPAQRWICEWDSASLHLIEEPGDKQ